LLKKLKYCDLTPNSSSACMIRFMSLSFMSEIVRIERWLRVFELLIISVRS
jgi:hypothetical protein